ncbi:rhomboid family intramembrane serine protease [Pedobacter sp. LMG 31464]|uniref:Rhomboid family intramembrane serine protease n=1 Tax=Pedobacter planticolens TaxID=2679964 RepID=A0A923IWX4_9SPHI|nr:rhomboid family intramembrane serine protease [Pedobacter planticolens]MBB2145677.1 rhomboid family intramembrane serine protease [Pedobacter planticolens]
MNNLNIPPVVKNLLIINVIFFIATLMFKNGDEFTLVKYLSVFYFDSPFFKPWQPVTYMFMHSPVDYFHIIFNMFALYSFGSALEVRWGAKKFFVFYFVTGLGALGLQWAVQAYEVYSVLGSITFDVTQTLNISPDKMQLLNDIYAGPMLGASGAIFGLLVGFGMLYPNAELFIMFIPVPVKAKYIIPIYILVELFLGVGKFQTSVAHFAHLGGALIGFILVKLWKDKNTPYDYYG